MCAYQSADDGRVARNMAVVFAKEVTCLTIQASDELLCRRTRPRTNIDGASSSRMLLGVLASQMASGRVAGIGVRDCRA